MLASKYQENSRLSILENPMLASPDSKEYMTIKLLQTNRAKSKSFLILKGLCISRNNLADRENVPDGLGGKT